MFDSSIDVAAKAVDEATAIRATIGGALQAWARGDGRTYAASFTPDCSDIAFFGVCRDGRAANAELHGALFQCAAKKAAMTPDTEAIEWLCDEVALVRTASFGPVAGYQTYVMVKRDGVWLIRSFQHTPVDRLTSWVAGAWRDRKPRVRG